MIPRKTKHTSKHLLKHAIAAPLRSMKTGFLSRPFVSVVLMAGFAAASFGSRDLSGV